MNAAIEGRRRFYGWKLVGFGFSLSSEYLRTFGLFRWILIFCIYSEEEMHVCSFFVGQVYAFVAFIQVKEILAITLDPWPGWCVDTVREDSTLILHSCGSCLHYCGTRYSSKRSEI